MAKSKGLSLSGQGLSYKLKIAFSLMSILPLLVSMYLVSNYILPRVGIKPDITVSMLVSIFVAIIGFFLIKDIFDRILSVSTEAKLIAAGDISRKIEKDRPDEVGDLSEALNQLTSRIRLNMDELKNYGEKTSQINFEIQKRVLALSSLLQISSLITQGARLDDILRLIAEKSRLMANADLSFLFFRPEGKEEFSMSVIDGLNANEMLKIKILPFEEIFGRFTKINKPFMVDKNNRVTDPLKQDFARKFPGLNNVLAFPVFLKGRVAAVFGVANNRDNFTYTKDDLEMLDVFSKQVAIAIENDLLLHRVERLEIKDALTGLYNQSFIRSRLQEEIKRAISYQRPCAFILLNLDNFADFHKNFGSLQAETVLKRAASLIRDSVTDIDRVARFGDNEFAVVLPEKNKRATLEVAENIRKKIEFTFNEEQDPQRRITVSGSVSENPLDGINAEELIDKARALLNVAKGQGKNKIAV